MTARDARAIARGRTEKALLVLVKDAAQKLGWTVYHARYSLGSDPGWPDLFMVRAVRVLAAELKGPRGRMTQEQLNWLAALERALIETAIWRWEHWDSGEIAEALR